MGSKMRLGPDRWGLGGIILVLLLCLVLGGAIWVEARNQEAKPLQGERDDGNG